MTLCIAAVNERQQEVVMACDMMLSTDYDSSEPWTTKMQLLSDRNRWVAAFTGVPSTFHVIQRQARAALDEEETLQSVRDSFQGAFESALDREIEAKILRQYQLDMPTFLKHGLTRFGGDEFSRLLREIEAVTLETQIMVAGFEPQGAARIVSFEERGECVQHEYRGFHAIGIGRFLALATLTGKPEAGDLSTAELVYRVCEAKFVGERALGVGKRTIVYVLRRDRPPLWMHPDRVEPIREVWEEVGRPKVPDKAIDLIGNKLTDLVVRTREVPK